MDHYRVTDNCCSMQLRAFGFQLGLDDLFRVVPCGPRVGHKDRLV